MEPRPILMAAYDYDEFEVNSDATGLACAVGSSMAKQSFAEEVDINTIIRRFGLTGELPTAVRMPEYGDYSTVSDFKTAMDAMAIANEAFDAMPAVVRSRFHNDPSEFVAFCLDDRNLPEARKLGLVPAVEAAAALAAAPQPTEGVGAASPVNPPAQIST